MCNKMELELLEREESKIENLYAKVLAQHTAISEADSQLRNLAVNQEFLLRRAAQIELTLHLHHNGPISLHQQQRPPKANKLGK